MKRLTFVESMDPHSLDVYLGMVFLIGRLQWHPDRLPRFVLANEDVYELELDLLQEILAKYDAIKTLGLDRPLTEEDKKLIRDVTGREP